MDWRKATDSGRVLVLVIILPFRLLVWVNTSSSKHTVKSAMSPVLVTVPVQVLQSAPSEQLDKKNIRTAVISKTVSYTHLTLPTKA